MNNPEVMGSNHLDKYATGHFQDSKVCIKTPFSNTSSVSVDKKMSGSARAGAKFRAVLKP